MNDCGWAITLLRGLAPLTMLAVVACARPTSESHPSGAAAVSAAAVSAAAPGTASGVALGAMVSALPQPPVAVGAMAPRLSAGKDGLLMTWIEPVGEGSKVGRRAKRHRVRFARLAGKRWSAPSTISEGAGVMANWADAPSAVQAGDGTLLAHWAEKSGTNAYAYDVMLARSNDGGQHWQPIGRVHDDNTASEHGFVSLLPLGDGVRAFWLDGRETAEASAHGAAAMTLRTAFVRGSSVIAGEVMDPRVCDCCGTSAVSTLAGPLVAYRDRREGEVRDIAFMGREGAGWWAPRLLNADGWKVPGCPVNGPKLAAEGDNIAAAWYTYVGGRSLIRLAFSRNGGHDWTPPILIDEPVGRRSPIGRVDVVRDGDGAVVSWMASERDQAVVLAARATPDGRVGRALPLARTSAARDSGFPQLERHGEQLVLLWTKAGKPSAVALTTVLPRELPTPGVVKRAASNASSKLLVVGSKAPDYGARSLAGGEARLSSLGGEVVLLNLWATWCEPCRRELGELTTLHQQYAAKGVRIVAVSVDGERSAAEILKFSQRRRLPYAIWHDREDRASSAFGVSTLPANFVIDRTGTIVWSKNGALTAADNALKRALDTALQSKP